MGNRVFSRRGTVSVLAMLAVSTTIAACGTDDATSEGNSRATSVMAAPKGAGWVGQLLAEQKGYWNQGGVEVELQEGDGSGFAVQQIIAGNADYAWPLADATLIAYERDESIRVLGCAEQQRIMSIVVPASSDIQSLEDLHGGMLGVTEQGGGEAQLVKAALSGAGLDGEVKVPALGDPGPSMVRAFRDGEIDAFAGGIADLTTLRAGGLDLRDITPTKFDSMPGVCLITTEGVLATGEGREQAAAVLAGWIRGMGAAIGDPDLALETVCEAAPESCQNKDVARSFLEDTLDLYGTGDDVGSSAPSGWKTTLEVLETTGVVEPGIDLEPLIGSPETEQVREAAYEEIKQHAGDVSGP